MLPLHTFMAVHPSVECVYRVVSRPHMSPSLPALLLSNSLQVAFGWGRDVVWDVLCEAQWSGPWPCWSRFCQPRPVVLAACLHHRLSTHQPWPCGKHALHLLELPVCGGVPKGDSASGSMGSGTRSTNAACSWSQEGFSSCCAYTSP